MGMTRERAASLASKYRLYDIDVVINKTVVYAALALFVSGVYVGLVVGVGSLVGQGDRPNVALSILATAVVAVAAQPVRACMQRRTGSCTASAPRPTSSSRSSPSASGANTVENGPGGGTTVTGRVPTRTEAVVR